MNLARNVEQRVIYGLGKSGLSCARYWRERGIKFCVVDTRPQPPMLTALRNEMPDIIFFGGDIPDQCLFSASEIVVGPGVDTASGIFPALRAQGISVVGDVELFCRELTAPVVAITGSNAKSTVTTLVGEMLTAAGVRVRVGGNIGIPVMELLGDDTVEAFVLELSSFQLETTDSARPAVAALLNITPDHMDRYATLADYVHAKQKVFNRCAAAVYNRADPLTQPLLITDAVQITFGLDQPDNGHFGLVVAEDESWLAYGAQLLLPVSQVRIQGKHNTENALAALAICHAFGLPLAPLLTTLQTFSGLAHRCELVRELSGVRYINDSKGTNVGATVAAVTGLAHGRNIVLIAGGDGKGADFSALCAPLADHVKQVILIGRDALRLEHSVGRRTPCVHASDLSSAVLIAQKTAVSGDVVLLSPACASFDMFRDFEDRGDQFSSAVRKLS